MGFLDSASSLCDMMNTTMAAVLNEIMSIQADEACGAGYGERSDARVNSRNGYRERRLETTVGTLPLLVPKLRRARTSRRTSSSAGRAPTGRSPPRSPRRA